MFCDGKTVSSVTGKCMSASSVQICRQRLASPLYFCWTQNSFKGLFGRKILQRTILVSEGYIKPLVLTHKRSVTEMLRTVYFCLLCCPNVTAILCFCILTQASFPEVLATCFDSITMCYPPVSQILWPAEICGCALNSPPIHVVLLNLSWSFGSCTRVPVQRENI